jgi:hypothetical protein
MVISNQKLSSFVAGSPKTWHVVETPLCKLCIKKRQILARLLRSIHAALVSKNDTVQIFSKEILNICMYPATKSK